MKTLMLKTADIEWTPGTDYFGPNAVRDGNNLASYKILSDRRAQGGGLTYLLKFSPPAGKLIKIVAVARSDEHIFPIQGDRSNKAGGALKFTGDYRLNPKGHPHSAFVAEESVSLVVYTGERDEVHEFAVIEPQPQN
ncbi:MAG: hypothetical protein ACREEA_10365 [Stellaceae bacterium]